MKKGKKIIIAVVSIIVAIVVLIAIIVSLVCTQKDNKNTKANKKTAETTTKDNRIAKNPFNHLVVEETESNGNFNIKDNIKSTDSELKNLSYEIVKVYKNENDFLKDQNKWDNNYKWEDIPISKLKENYFDRKKGEVLIIQVSRDSIKEYPNIRFEDSAGRNYYKYIVKAIHKKKKKIKYLTYSNDRFGYKFKYPSFFKDIAKTPENGDGIILKGKGATLTMSGEKETTGETTGQDMKNSTKELIQFLGEGNIKNDVVTENSYYYEDHSRNTWSINYSDYSSNTGITASFTLSFNKKELKKYQKIAKRIKNSLKRFEGQDTLY